MGSIRELPIKNGGNSYHAEVRLKGFPPQRRVCRTKTQAKQWIQGTRTGHLRDMSPTKMGDKRDMCL